MLAEFYFEIQYFNSY